MAASIAANETNSGLSYRCSASSCVASLRRCVMPYAVRGRELEMEAGIGSVGSLQALDRSSARPSIF
jgi:hypothetical protein